MRSVFLPSTLAPKKNSYSRRYRLTRESELEAVKQTGRRLGTEHLEARAAVSLLSHCRIAVIVAKSGHTIVERNRLRRRIRELARIRLLPHCASVDMVIRALPSAYGADFSQLGAEVDDLKVRLVAIAPRA